MEGLKMNEEKTLYEIITNLKNENAVCILTIGRFVAITFTPADMCEINRFKQTFFTTTDLSKLTVSVDDYVKFKKTDENESWSYFSDCNNLGYELSIKDEE